jgi:hypothetical protein
MTADGKAPAAGQLQRNPDLAATFRRLAQHGAAQGETEHTQCPAVLEVSCGLARGLNTGSSYSFDTGPAPHQTLGQATSTAWQMSSRRLLRQSDGRCNSHSAAAARRGADSRGPCCTPHRIRGPHQHHVPRSSRVRGPPADAGRYYRAASLQVVRRCTAWMLPIR